jgi:hypothetical protein
MSEINKNIDWLDGYKAGKHNLISELSEKTNLVEWVAGYVIGQRDNHNQMLMDEMEILLEEQDVKTS